MKNGTKINKLNEKAATRRLGLFLVKTGVKAGRDYERPAREAKPIEKL